MKLLSIVIPVYNEKNTVIALLDRVLAAPLSIDRELLIVNDGSTDGSGELIQQWIEEHPQCANLHYFAKANGGKGSAVRCGIDHSRGDVVIIQDADLEYDPGDYQKCIDPILRKEALVVYGSRERYTLNRAKSSWGFYLGGLSVSLAFNLLYGTSLTDEPTCYKTFDGDLIRRVTFANDHFGWEPEVTAKVLRMGIEIQEVPISYHPRKITEGKKIRLKDGLEALFLAAWWRIRPLGALEKKVAGVISLVESKRSFVHCVWLLIAIAFLLRLALALPGLCEGGGGALLRLDSGSFMAGDARFDPAARGPGYVWLLSLLGAETGGNLVLAGVVGCLLSALTLYPAAYTCKVLFGRTAGLWTAGLLALNLTAIGIAPLILSDTLFTFFVGFQVFFLVRLWRYRRLIDFGYGLFFALLAALTRGVNLPFLFVVLPVLAVIFLRPGWKIFFALNGIAIGVLFVIVPFMYRNHLDGSGFTLESNAANVYFHNGSAILAHQTKRNSDLIREEMRQAFMQKYPDLNKEADAKAKMAEYFELCKTYPGSFLATHLPQPYLLLPDLPSVSENLKLSRGGSGTLAVIRQQGLWAGVRHYFGDRSGMMLVLLSPLLLATLLVYLGCVYQLCMNLWRREWLMVILFGALSLYYVALPGPVIMPRYQLPALFLIYAFGVAGLGRILKKHL